MVALVRTGSLHQSEDPEKAIFWPLKPRECPRCLAPVGAVKEGYPDFLVQAAYHDLLVLRIQPESSSFQSRPLPALFLRLHTQPMPVEEWPKEGV
jgi:hypothetical protein